MATRPTTKAQLDAAWDRFKLWNNLSMPVFLYRLVNVTIRARTR